MITSKYLVRNASHNGNMEEKNVSLSIKLEAREPNNNDHSPKSSVVLQIYFAVVLILGFFISSWNHEIFHWLAACFLGNLAIGFAVFLLHKTFTTGRYPDFNSFILKNVGNFLEVLVYSILLSLQQFTLLAAILIAKSVGDIGNPKNTSSIVSVYRLGIALQVILLIFAAYLFTKTSFYLELKQVSFFITKIPR